MKKNKFKYLDLNISEFYAEKYEKNKLVVDANGDVCVYMDELIDASFLLFSKFREFYIVKSGDYFNVLDCELNKVDSLLDLSPDTSMKDIVMQVITLYRQYIWSFIHDIKEQLYYEKSPIIYKKNKYDYEFVKYRLGRMVDFEYYLDDNENIHITYLNSNEYE